MNNVGIICDLTYNRHHLFKSYYHAVKNLFGTPKVVNSVNDLHGGVQLLFIPDSHFPPHKEVWQSFGFMPYCNANDIKIIVLDNEKILNSFFPWNMDNLKMLQKFNHLYHYSTEVDDCDKLGLKLNRTTLSRYFMNTIPTDVTKKDKIVFIGETHCPKNSYQVRKKFLCDIQKEIEIDIMDCIEWEDYLRIIAEYRFVLSPLGNGNFFTMRFYEILAVKSIPLHQVKENTLDWYDIERGFSDCIFFEQLPELKEKLDKFSLKESHNMIWMEDNIEKLLKEDNLM